MKNRPSRGLVRSGVILLVAILGVALAIQAGFNILYLTKALVANGPNTVGEAGKVYFASKIQAGGRAWATGDTPPYYPSLHGVLLHFSVGALGRVFGSSTSELYWIGRSLSVLFTLSALGLAASIARRTGVPNLFMIFGFLLWIGTYAITQHTVSYRPDNWLLFLSVLSCWLLIREPRGPVAIAVLVFIPTLAFLIKAPGVGLGLAIVAALFVQGRVRTGAVVALAQSAVLLLALGAIDLSSGGGFSSAMRMGGEAGFSARHLLVSLADPVVAFVVLFPGLFMLLPLFRALVRRNVVVRVLFAYWAATLLCYGAAATRAGSNSYYFLEPMTYGLILTLVWLVARLRVGQASLVSLVPYLLAVAVVTIPGTVRVATLGNPEDVALVQTSLVGNHRSIVADHVNSTGSYCYSDDPGLNVLLDRPAIIYPLLQVQLIHNGRMAHDAL